jgi:hypothetical protein
MEFEDKIDILRLDKYVNNAGNFSYEIRNWKTRLLALNSVIRLTIVLCKAR